MARMDAQDVNPAVNAKFGIWSADKIATTGSCFAQHISRKLMSSGYQYLVTENGDPLRQYGVYPARFGNIYTSRQLHQLFQRAYGLFDPHVDIWRDAGRVVDPFRPQIEAGGFESQEAMLHDREGHMRAVREMFESADVFVFTLGLTETWISRSTGAVFPVAPGVSGGPDDVDDYYFHNLKFTEIVDDLKKFIADFRVINRDVRIILTVSPVPLVATYENKHVLVATTYSKSVLRVAAEEISQSDGLCDYFPSYEIITGNHNRHKYWDSDLRSVTGAGVEMVMGIFEKNLLHRNTSSEQFIDKKSHRYDGDFVRSDHTGLAEVICEEEAIDR